MNAPSALAHACADEAPPAVDPVVLRGATKGFGPRILFEGVDLRIRRGEFVALLGASGSGKTTLLRILLGLDTLDAGAGAVAAPRSAVFQEPRLVPSQTVWRNVLMGLPWRAQRRRRALGALEEVGLGAHADAWPVTLSGGEAQRVALARALILEPALLLLDEPFAALDALTRLRMQDLVRRLCARYRPGTLIVTHDVDEAVRLADRVLVLRDRRLTLDVAVGAAQDPASAAGARLRARLLAELGVAPDDAGIAARGSTAPRAAVAGRA
ncbi:Vitamin B12 import ATP-binding protein BtuD [Methylobacterium crusticola]|uniref:Vitamin B12 import ATP-binding protein BtuD n=1 Tax=Methylobacterium crusticola TaxID=1697972 RepID=A0ABQ4RA91_9HYPH|nr:ABC transporter ATP-binding protein [Methylobacterium crusticola]GJD53704.1 Vitamin B12 import ATP-binding protein BtuD [Methylobacterium crusticola]